MYEKSAANRTAVVEFEPYSSASVTSPDVVGIIQQHPVDFCIADPAIYISRQNRLHCKSDSAYFYTFLRIVVCLSSVWYIYAPA